MNFELAEELGALLRADNLSGAITFAEGKLRQLAPTDFNVILGRDLTPLSKSLCDYMDSFYQRVKKRIKVKALYCEMNGFTINPDLWFLDAFAYDTFGGVEDFDWLADFDEENSTDESFVIKGMEDLQAIYEEYMEKEKWKDKKQQASSDICEMLVILRLHELLRETVKLGRQKKMEWADVPVFVTPHEYNDLIYKA